MLIEFEMIREGLMPSRSNPSDAGMDVFFNPPEEDNSPMIVGPGKNTLLPTGVKFGVPHGYMLQAMNRSSMAAKRSLVVGAHCIDSGYEGEVFIDLHNIGTDIQVVQPGEKVAQLVLVPIIPFRLLKGDSEMYSRYPISMSNRGEGALGSTDVEQ
jgi:dUTP pyrophosphatase